MQGILAVTEDGRVTKCYATPENRGKGRCNHISHQKEDETEEEFILRINDQLADYSSYAPKDKIELVRYIMSEDEKESLTEIKGRKQLADEENEGGYIELDTPLWNDVDLQDFSNKSEIQISKLKSILNSTSCIVEEPEGSRNYKIISKSKEEIKKGEIFKENSGVLALNEFAKNEYDFEATKNIYVVPYYLRQDPPDCSAKHPLNGLYNAIIVARKNPNNQQLAYERLINNRESNKPLKDRNGFATDSLCDEFAGKSGVMRAYMSGRRVPYSGRAVISTEINMPYGQLAIPATMAVDIYRPTLNDRLIQEGLTQQERKAWFGKFDDDISNIKKEDMQELSKYVIESGVKVLANRPPSLHASNLLAFYPRISSTNTIKVNPLNLPGFNADHDGDTFSVYAINDLRVDTSDIDADSIAGTRRARQLSKSIIMPEKESLFGILSVLKKRK